MELSMEKGRGSWPAIVRQPWVSTSEMCRWLPHWTASSLPPRKESSCSNLPFLLLFFLAVEKSKTETVQRKADFCLIIQNHTTAKIWFAFFLTLSHKFRAFVVCSYVQWTTEGTENLHVPMMKWEKWALEKMDLGVVTKCIRRLWGRKSTEWERPAQTAESIYKVIYPV